MSKSDFEAKPLVTGCLSPCALVLGLPSGRANDFFALLGAPSGRANDFFAVLGAPSGLFPLLALLNSLLLRTCCQVFQVMCTQSKIYHRRWSQSYR